MCRCRSRSPGVTWRGLPPSTRQIVVAFQDDDEPVPPPMRPPFLHWVVYNIPPQAKGLPAGIPFAETLTAPPDLLGAAQAYTAFSYPGYRGPQPPPGQLHHYRLTLFALDRDLGLAPALPVYHGRPFLIPPPCPPMPAMPALSETNPR